MTTAAAIVVPAAARQTATLIFLHGLGDTGAGWSWLPENFRLRRKFDECTFIFPHAPRIPITLNGGISMPGWFDIASLSDLSPRQDEKGILAAVKKIHEIIDEQIDKGISSERIVLGGFSQGGAIALLGGLTCRHKLGGIVGLSTWLPLHHKFAGMEIEPNRETPIFLGHGEIDHVVKYTWGESTRKELEKVLGYNVEWHSYPNLDHSADLQEVTDVERWLQSRLPAQD